MALNIICDGGLKQQQQAPAVRRSARLGHQQSSPTTSANTVPAPKVPVAGPSTSAARTKSVETAPSLSKKPALSPNAIPSSRKRSRAKERQNSQTESDSDSEGRRPMRPSVTAINIKSAKERPVKAIRSLKTRPPAIAPAQAPVSAPDPTPRSLRAQKRQRLSDDCQSPAIPTESSAEDLSAPKASFTISTTSSVPVSSSPIARRTRSSKRSVVVALAEQSSPTTTRIVAPKKRRVKSSSAIKTPIESGDVQQQAKQNVDLLSCEQLEAKRSFSEVVPPSEDTTKVSSGLKGEELVVNEEPTKSPGCAVETESKTGAVTRQSTTALSAESLESQAKPASETEAGVIPAAPRRMSLRSRRVGTARTLPSTLLKALKPMIPRKTRSSTTNPITGKTRAASFLSVYKAAGGRRVGRPPKTRKDNLPSAIFGETAARAHVSREISRQTASPSCTETSAHLEHTSSTRDPVLSIASVDASLDFLSVAPALKPAIALPSASSNASVPSCRPKSPPSSPPSSPLRALNAPIQPYIHSPLSPLAHTTSTTPPGSPPSRYSRASPPLDAVDLGPLEPLVLPTPAVPIAKDVSNQVQDDLSSGNLSSQPTMFRPPSPVIQGTIVHPHPPANTSAASPIVFQSIPTSSLPSTFADNNGIENPIQPLAEVHMTPISTDVPQLTMAMPIAQQAPQMGMFGMDMSMGMPLPLPIGIQMPMGNPADISAMNMDMAAQMHMMPPIEVDGLDHGMDMNVTVTPTHVMPMGVLSESDLGFGFQSQDNFAHAYPGTQPPVYIEQPQQQNNVSERQIHHPQAQPAQSQAASAPATGDQNTRPPTPRIQMHLVGERPIRYKGGDLARSLPHIPLEASFESPKETRIWRIAAQTRVSYVARTYTAEVLRDIVAQEAHDYYTRIGHFPLGYNGTDIKHRRRSTLSTGQSSTEANIPDMGGDEFMSEKTYAFELADDDEGMEDEGMEDDWDEEDDSDEDEDMIDVLAEAEKAALAGMSGDEDAEGEMEVDIEPFSDPSFNAELSSATPSPALPPSPINGCETNFYVPPRGTYQVQYAEQQAWDTQVSVQQAVQPVEQGQEHYHHQQHAQIQLTPVNQGVATAAPILPLPPPRLSLIRVPQLINHSWNAPPRHGTPRDRLRNVQWGRGYAKWCVAKLAAQTCRQIAEDRAKGILRPRYTRRNQKRKADDELDEESEARSQPKMRLILNRRGLHSGKMQMQQQQPVSAQQQQFEMPHHLQQQAGQNVGGPLTEQMPEPNWESFLTNFDDKQAPDQAHSQPPLSMSEHAITNSAVTLERQQLPVVSTSTELGSALAYPAISPRSPPAPDDQGQMFNNLSMFDFSGLLGSGAGWYAPLPTTTGVADGALDGDLRIDGGMGGVNGENSDSHGAGSGTSTLSFALG